MSEFQAIKNPAEARRLLKLGNPIYDIAPKKEYGKENKIRQVIYVKEALHTGLKESKKIIDNYWE